MPLFLVPSDDSLGDRKVLHGQLVVGQIYRRSAALRAETQWLWALNGVPDGPEALQRTGLAATPQEGLSALTEQWSKWLDWANLTERIERHQERPR
jgi:hypothetical protein